MPQAAKKEDTGERMPGFSMGVRDNASVRMVKLASPICPYSKVEIDISPEGRPIPSRSPSGITNCQLAGGNWWVDCEERGHDPYFRTQVHYVKRDKWEEQEDGTQLLVGTETIRKEERVPNFIQCPVGLRYGGAQDVGYKLRRSIEKKGRKRLRAVGYPEVCQYRNCQSLAHKKYSSTRFGEYCSFNHMALIAADWNEVALVQITGRTELGMENKIRQKRETQLREAAAFAFDGGDPDA